MRTAEEILKEYFSFEDVNQSETVEILPLTIIDMMEEYVEQFKSYWIKYNWDNKETRPTSYGKYIVCRKDGKVHLETWNGSGWAYNEKSIRYWINLILPEEMINKENKKKN